MPIITLFCPCILELNETTERTFYCIKRMLYCDRAN